MSRTVVPNTLRLWVYSIAAAIADRACAISTTPGQATRIVSLGTLVKLLIIADRCLYGAAMTEGKSALPPTRLPQPHRQLRLGASLLTPFDEQNDLNEEVYRAQVRRLASAGLDLWIVSSGTAEGNVLSSEEVDRLAQLTTDEAGPNVSVYAMGTEPRSARHAIEFCKRMSDFGVTAVQVGPVEPGHSYVPTEDELRSFYDSVLSATQAPAILTSHVSAGYEIVPETLAAIAADHGDRVLGLTATHLQNNAYLPRLLEAVGDRFPVWTGSPLRAIDSCALGAKGFTSSMDVNIAPELYTAFMAAWAAGDLPLLAQTYRSTLRLFQRVLGAGGLIILKAILVRLGLPVGTTRPPRRAAGDTEFRIADEIIAEFELQAV
jgi:4-hydroxy-tetrahydrodipicolinate synthase